MSYDAIHAEPGKPKRLMCCRSVISCTYGFNDQKAQTWMNQNLYVILWFGALWLAAFLPTHLALRKIFAASRTRNL